MGIALNMARGNRVDLRGFASLRASGPPKDCYLRERGRLVETHPGESPQIVNVGEAFKRLGYHFAYRHVDARRYLLPHRRTRVWMWAVREDISAAPAASRVNALLEQLEQPEPAPLDPFLEFAAGGKLTRQELTAREEEAVNDVLSSRSALRLGKAALKGLVIDISKSTGRAPWCAGATPCVLPNSRLC